MLFDLKGKRRRAVQAIYLTLAVLMGGGLVFFGIGSDVSGGLFDAFSGDGGSGNGSSLVDKRVEAAQARLERNPRDGAALRELARAEFQLAGQDADPNTGVFGKEGRDNLERSGAAWERYLALDPQRPDASLAGVMVQVYGEGALNRPAKAAQAAEIVAEVKPTPNAYLVLARYATLARDTRKAGLAEQKALDLAPKRQHKAIKAQLAQLKAAPAAGGAGAAGAGGGG